MTRLITTIILASTTALWLAWEIYAAVSAGRSATFSEVLRQLDTDSGHLVALGIAALYVHLFFFPKPFWLN